MSARITRRDCDRAFENLKSAAIVAGFDSSRVERWGYSIGSKMYGNTSKLYQIGANTVTDSERAENKRLHYNTDDYPYGSGHYSTGLPEFLGWGPTDTYDTLRTITQTLWAVAGLKNHHNESCICTSAIAGISDGPNVDCPIHGDV